MRLNKSIAVGVVTLGLLAGSATNVVAQLSVGTGVSVSQDCAIAATPIRCDWTASDPRLTGTMTHEWAGEVFGTGDDTSVGWAPATLAGPEGDWAGHLYAVWTDPAQLFVMLSGDGAYDGWQYVASTIDSEVSPGDSEWVGMLYEGELPPVGPPAE